MDRRGRAKECANEKSVVARIGASPERGRQFPECTEQNASGEPTQAGLTLKPSGAGRHQYRKTDLNFNMRRSLETCTDPRPLQRLVQPALGASIVKRLHTLSCEPLQAILHGLEDLRGVPLPVRDLSHYA
jgi:hypothetical protein